MFGRRRAKTHGQLMRAELGEGVDHLRQAAVHGAAGVGAAVGPAASSARDAVSPQVHRMREVTASGVGTMTAALLPLMAAARDGAETASRGVTRKAGRVKAKATRGRTRSRRRRRLMVGLLVAGAAAGATGAMVARRRNRTRWQEYDQTGADTARADARSITERVTSVADRASGKAAEWTSSAKETMHDWAHGAKDTAKTATDQAEAKADSAADYGRSKAEQFSDKAATVSKNAAR